MFTISINIDIFFIFNMFYICKINFYICKMENEFEFEPLKPREKRGIHHGDLRLVDANVEGIFEWSDKIIDEYSEETGEVILYKSGFIIHIQSQQIIYEGQESIFLANVNIDNNGK